jgi:hypothetical protein
MIALSFILSTVSAGSDGVLSTSNYRKSSVYLFLQCYIPHLRFSVCRGDFLIFGWLFLQATGSNRDPLAGPPYNIAWVTIISRTESCVHGIIKRAPSFVRLCVLWPFIVFVHGSNKLSVPKYQGSSYPCWYCQNCILCESNNFVWHPILSKCCEWEWNLVCHPEGGIIIDVVRRLPGLKKNKETGE